MTYSLIYSTFGSIENARQVAQVLLDSNLIACANIFPQMESMYTWNGSVQNDLEIVVLFKTTAELYSRVEQKIIENHAYDVPCVLEIPIRGGSEKFLKWLDEQVSK